MSWAKRCPFLALLFIELLTMPSASVQEPAQVKAGLAGMLCK
jgi:hypothetical protein